MSRDWRDRADHTLSVDAPAAVKAATRASIERMAPAKVRSFFWKDSANQKFRTGIAQLLQDNVHVHIPLNRLSEKHRAIVLEELRNPGVIPHLKNVVLDLSSDHPAEDLPPDFPAVLETIRALSEKGGKGLGIEVNLSGRRLHGEEGLALAETLVRSKVSRLSLRGCWFEPGSNVLATLAGALQAAEKLTHLDLRRNPAIGNEGLAELAGVLPHCHVTDLNLAECALSARSMSLLATAIRQPTTTLRALTLERNEEAGNGFASLFDALPHSALETLDVSRCRLGGSRLAMNALMQALSSPDARLGTLRLQNNVLNRNDYVHDLVWKLIDNLDSKLRALDLSHNHLGDRDLLSLLSGITGMDYFDHKIGLRRSCRLSDLRLKGGFLGSNDFSLDSLKELSFVLQTYARSIPLQSLAMDCELFDHGAATLMDYYGAAAYHYMSNWTNPYQPDAGGKA